MAYKRIPTSTSLQIAVLNGTDSNGNAKFITKSFSGLKPDASPENILVVGNAIGAILAKEANGVYVSSKELVINEE